MGEERERWREGKESGLVFEVEDDGGDDPDVFHKGGGGAGVLDGELALGGGLHFADFGVAVFGELLCGFAGVLGGLGNHVGLDVVEGAELIINIGVGIGDAFFEQVGLAVEEFSYFVDLVCGYSDVAAQGVFVSECA